MELRDLLHEIVSHLPVHDKVREALHLEIQTGIPSEVNGDSPEQAEEA